MMNDRVREALLGYLLGALEDAQRARVEALLRREPQLYEDLETLREQIEPLAALREDVSPPPGLARRTCEYVFARAAVPARRVRQAFLSCAGSAGWAGRSPRADVFVTACVLVAVSLLAVTAIQASRFRCHIAACQDNLREIGTALTQSSQLHHGYFSADPAQGKLAAAGIYAPNLADQRLLTELRHLGCPGAKSVPPEVLGPVDLERAGDEQLARLLPNVGGSYAYTMGHVRNGAYCDTKNLYRPTSAIIADLPSATLPGRQSLNHDGRGENVLFEDGHVLFLADSRPADLRDDLYHADLTRFSGSAGDDSAYLSTVTPIVSADLR